MENTIAEASPDELTPRNPCACCACLAVTVQYEYQAIWSTSKSTQDTIRDQVTQHPVVLYMKGTPQFPQCGFSSAAVQMLQACGVDRFFSVNVLADEAIRQGIKDYANWPTIPQLYVNGEFVGGCDIMREMYESGELRQLLARQAA